MESGMTQPALWVRIDSNSVDNIKKMTKNIAPMDVDDMPKGHKVGGDIDCKWVCLECAKWHSRFIKLAVSAPRAPGGMGLTAYFRPIESLEPSVENVCFRCEDDQQLIREVQATDAAALHIMRLRVLRRPCGDQVRGALGFWPTIQCRYAGCCRRVHPSCAARLVATYVRYGR